jgi:uncharacterized protein YebE (UPF0316 family)
MSVQNDIQIKPTLFRIFWYNSKLVLIVLIFLTFCEILFGIRSDYERWFIERLLLFIIMVLIFSMRDVLNQRNRVLYISILGVSKIKGYKVDEKVFIAYKEIDIIKSKKQNLLQNIIGLRSIYSLNNDVIEFTPQLYSKEDQKILYDKLKI